MRGAVWSSDGNVTYGANVAGGLHRVPAAGGELEVLAQADRDAGEEAYWFPDVLPGSEVVLLTFAHLELASYDDASIVAVWPGTGDKRVLIEGGSSARYKSPRAFGVRPRGRTLPGAVRCEER